MTTAPATSTKARGPRPIGRLARRGPAVPAPARTVALVVGMGVAGDVLLRAGAATVAIGLFAAAVVVTLIATRLLRTPSSIAVASAAVLFAALTGVRASPWLVPLDLIAAVGLIATAAAIARGGRLDDIGARDVVASAGRMMLFSTARSPRWITEPLRSGVRDRPPIAAVLRGLALAVPLVLALAVLLASADAVFAALFAPSIDAVQVADHALVIAVCTAVVATPFVEAASPTVAARTTGVRMLGTTETTIVLSSLVALFAVFALTQFVALTGGADRVIATAGLTRAEYARDGFFQLLWVAAITLVTLSSLRGVLRVATGRTRQRLHWLLQSAIGLTLVVVIVAIGRLDLYADAFGLTMLRWYSTLFAGWIGVVFLGLSVAVAGVGSTRRWLLPFAAGSGLALLLALNIGNVEAFVVDVNVGRGTVARLDASYLTSELSADAVPALVGALDELPRRPRDDLRAGLCVLDLDVILARSGSGLSFNWSRWRADRAVMIACGR